MAKIGPVVTDPKAGAYCRITLDNGEKIIVNHEKSGRLIIERLKLFGFSSERIFGCDLENAEGRTALRFLTRDVQPEGLDTSPLGAFVRYLKTCQSVEEIKARCSALMAIHRSTDA
jgi:hypothetical protein